jgi:hypothetical protein
LLIGRDELCRLGYILRMVSGLRSTPGATTTRRRDLTLPAGFIPPCLPMMAPRPPSDPLEQRKTDLSWLLADASPGLVLNKWIDGNKFDGTTVFEHVCSAGREGIVSKRKDSRYISGRSPYWLKMKNPTSEAAKLDTNPTSTGSVPTRNINGIVR